MEFLQGLTDYPWWVIVPAALGLFSAIATVTPNKVDNKIVDFILKVVNLLGLNVGKAKNADDN